MKKASKLVKKSEKTRKTSKPKLTLKKGGSLIGKKCIFRTCSAGAHYGKLIEKEGNEVILKNAVRLYFWKTVNAGLSLSEIANHGVHHHSKLCEKVDLLWLEAIEIIPCTKEAIKNIEAQPVYLEP